MLKRTILFLGLTSFVFAQEDDVALLKQQLKDLQKEVQELKRNQKKHERKTDYEFNELYDFSESVETRVLEDKLKFSLALRFGDDFIEKKYANGNSVKNNNMLTTKFMLGIRAHITDELRFYGRLSMYKYWGSSAVHPYSYYDNMQGRVPSDSALYVERAYLDWFFFNDSSLPMALTIGRQPSADGPSHQYKDNLKRKATYSALLYDGVADGAVWTLNFSKILQYPKTYLRFGYSKGFGYVSSDKYIGNAFIGASNDDIKDTNVYGIFFDTTLPEMPNSLVQISYSLLDDIIANPLDVDYSNNKNIGDMTLFGLMVEADDVADLHLDLFAHYGYNKSNPNGKTYIDPNGNAVGLLGDGQEEKSGYAYWLGGRYSFGEDSHYKIGFEYNHGSKDWVSLTQGGYDLYNKLATRGDAYETYLMYIVNRYLNFRIGYIAIDYAYSRSGWFVGEGEKIVSQSGDIPNEESYVDSLHSIYLKMNLVY
ncbi:MAG: DUF3373 domain-containing protein [Epsilonproteobacteria bacterium]|nr:DUF3373 domain-containing protein [Campylobacterota bacterium]